MTRKILALAFLTWVALPIAVLAKRTPAPVIEPIVHEGVRYTIPNDNGTKGYVVASDPITGKQLWKKTVFRKCICPFLEHDVQWVFLQRMRLDAGRLILVDERGRTYSVDVKTHRVTKLKKQEASPQRSNPVQIERRLQEVFAAAESKDFDRLDGYHLYGPKFTKFSGSSPDRLDAAAGRKGEHAGLRSAKGLKMQASALKIDMFDNVAIATFILDYSFESGGQVVHRKDRSTLVFVKEAGEWKIAHEHLSPINP